MQDGSCGQTTSRVSAVVFVGSLALGAGSLDAFALSNTYKDIFAYKLGGFADQSAFIGFNNSKIDRAKGIYPTQRYATIVGYLGLDLNFLPKSPSHKIKVKFGGAVGGVLYDGTKNSSEGSVVNDFFGYYNGFMGGYVNILDDDSIPVQNAKYNKATRNYVFSDAYIEYDYKNHFGFKGGRYKSKMEYRGGWTQGFEVYGGGRDFRLTWFSSWGRAFAYGSYIQDWYAARPTFSGNYTKNSSGGYDKHGYPILLGTHALQLNYSRHKFQLEGFFTFPPKFLMLRVLKWVGIATPTSRGEVFAPKQPCSPFSPFIIHG